MSCGNAPLQPRRCRSGAGIAVLLVAWAPLAAASHAQTMPQPASVPAWAAERMGRWYAAFNAGDAAEMMTLYAADATLLLQGRAFHGLPAIEAFHRTNFASARFTCTWTIEGAEVVDRLAAVWGGDECTEMPRGGGASTRWTGRWLTVFQRQADGSWMIVRDTGEEERPAAAAPPR